MSKLKDLYLDLATSTDFDAIIALPKSSTPDWMFPEMCDCQLAMCPECDTDFAFEMARDLEFFLSDDTPPF